MHRVMGTPLSSLYIYFSQLSEEVGITEYLQFAKEITRYEVFK